MVGGKGYDPARMPLYEIQPDVQSQARVRDLTWRLRTAVTLLLCTVLVSTIGFVALGRHIDEPYTWFLALWDTLNLVSTVGSLREDFTLGQRAWAMFVIAFGLGAVLYGFGTMQSLLNRDVYLLYARRKLKRTLEQTSGHILVCGYGEVGRTVAREVGKFGKQLVIIDLDEKMAADAGTEGLLVVQGDCTRDETLRAAGIERAEGLIASLDTDAANVYLALTARELNPRIRVVARAEREESRPKLRRAGADKVIVPGEQAGRELANLILKPNVMEFMEMVIGAGEYDFVEVEVKSYPSLEGRALAALDLPREADAMVFSIVDGKGAHTFNPSSSRVLAGGDTLLLVCRQGGLERLERLGGSPTA